jgi:ribosomal protein S18 acetylase RimI-like enzyme
VTRRFAIARLNSSHDRASFSCGVEPLDRYFRQTAGQDSRKRVANCFVAVESETGSIAGHYTLSAASIPVTELPEETARRLPHYPQVPAALIGRLAVDSRFQGERLGEALLLDAADRAIDSDPAVFALVVDAKNESAAAFYRRYEFLPLTAHPLTLFLPVAALAARRKLDTSP